MKRVALLMGSFNPIHRGHTSIADYVLTESLADEVWFVVSPQNPLKDAAELAPFEDRFNMVALAVAYEPRFVACDIEQSLDRPSYTINTIRHIRACYVDIEFTILAGSDIAHQLPQWREYKELRQLARFMIYPRGDAAALCSSEMGQAPRISIDSTTIRHNVELHSVEIDPSVFKYITERNLYPMKTIEDYTKLIAKEPHIAYNYMERGRLHYRSSNFGHALNDFSKAIELDANLCEAREFKIMTEAILNFRNLDLYNP